MNTMYIDAEFDAVRIKGRHQQMVVSLGAVVRDEEGQEQVFYALIHPLGFRRLTPVVRKMTHLKDEQIRNAKSFPEVLAQFQAWVQYWMDKMPLRLYSFGPDDRRTLMQNCRLHGLQEDLFASILDLQKELSATVRFQGQVVSATLSLDDLKSVYGIQGAVDHNALSDARDLMYIHEAAQRHGPSVEEITNIVNRKVAKQLEVRRKQQERLTRIMRERFAPYTKKAIPLILHPEIITLLNNWEDCDQGFHIHANKNEVKIDGSVYPTSQLQVTMQLMMEETIPYVRLVFQYEEECGERNYPLHYRNAGVVEAICKRLRG